jgi:hypothetical protein
MINWKKSLRSIFILTLLIFIFLIAFIYSGGTIDKNVLKKSPSQSHLPLFFAGFFVFLLLFVIINVVFALITGRNKNSVPDDRVALQPKQAEAIVKKIQIGSQGLFAPEFKAQRFLWSEVLGTEFIPFDENESLEDMDLESASALALALRVKLNKHGSFRIYYEDVESSGFKLDDIAKAIQFHQLPLGSIGRERLSRPHFLEISINA